MTKHRWQLEGSKAHLNCDAFGAEFDCTRPMHGLFFGKRQGPERLLAVGAEADAGSVDVVYDPALAESYARGDDLVVTYPQTEARPFRMQTYWRLLNCEFLSGAVLNLGVELQVSINTSLLDTHPAVAVESQFSQFQQADVASIAVVGDAIAVVRPQDKKWSYVEMVHPVDRGAPTDLIHSADGVVLRTRLFGKFLEKGVILRARMRGAIVRRDGDEAAALALYEDFRHAPLPLTT